MSKINFAFLIHFVCLGLLQSECRSADSRLDQYISAAFGTSRLLAVRLASPVPFRTRVVCASTQCNEKEKTIVTIIPSIFKPADTLSQQIPIEILFRNDAKQNSEIQTEGALLGPTLFSDGSSECGITVKATQSVIQNVRVWVSSEIPIRQAQTCILVQLFRGVGLQLLNGANFETYWQKSGPKLQAMSESEFMRISERMESMVGIHYCPAIKDFWAKARIEQALSSPTDTCLN